MEKMLKNCLEGISSEELAAFEEELGSIAERCESEDTETVLRLSMQKAGISRRHPVLRRRVMIILAAALVLIPTATAVAGNRNTHERFFNMKDDSAPVVREFYKREVSAENDDAKLVVEGVFSDELLSYVMVSFHAKNDTGRQHIRDMKYFLDNEEEYREAGLGDYKEFRRRVDDAMMPYMNLYSNAPQYFNSIYNFVFYQEPVTNANMHSNERYINKENDDVFNIKFVFDNRLMDTGKPLHLIEALSGLNVDIDISKNMELIRLEADSPGGYHDVRISPLAVYIRFDERDTKYAVEASKPEAMASVHLRNGQIAPILSSGSTGTLDLNDNPMTHERWVEMGRYSYSDLCFREPIDTEELDYVEIEGKKYRPAAEAEKK